jgi:hypothetical protein
MLDRFTGSSSLATVYAPIIGDGFSLVSSSLIDGLLVSFLVTKSHYVARRKELNNRQSNYVHLCKVGFNSIDVIQSFVLILIAVYHGDQLSKQ